jgi:hypothetical protein
LVATVQVGVFNQTIAYRDKKLSVSLCVFVPVSGVDKNTVNTYIDLLESFLILD